jgi:phosphate starvation-inducible protein PhoH and related proteins
VSNHKPEKRHRHYTVSGKTPKQISYIKTILNNDITICVGPAGTGKTFIATALAIIGLHKGEYDKIVISRPLVQSGEDVGTLPGDIGDKLQPYLQPVYDELLYYIKPDEIRKFIENGQIEIVPIGLMRGRNFHNCFIICDEMQNCTEKQLKLVLTRLGQGSTMVLTGDFTQSDLPVHQDGGLKKLTEALINIDGVGVSHLGYEDIVRHPTIGKILEALENHEKKKDRNS